VQVAYGLWFIAEVAIASTDLAEVIGSAVALNLLFGLPIWAGVLITAADVLFIILFGVKNFRLIEILVMLLCMVITGCFAYEVGAAKPDWAGVASGLIPKGKIVTNSEILYAAIGILGATVMPHNLFLHSSIVQVCTRAFILHVLTIALDPVLPNADPSFRPFSARKKVCSEVRHNRQSHVSALGFLRECCHVGFGQCSIPLWQKPKLNSG
jgi:Mn2+/Fe2+ NRAMP family transporter